MAQRLPPTTTPSSSGKGTRGQLVLGGGWPYSQPQLEATVASPAELHPGARTPCSFNPGGSGVTPLQPLLLAAKAPQPREGPGWKAQFLSHRLQFLLNQSMYKLCLTFTRSGEPSRFLTLDQAF